MIRFLLEKEFRQIFRNPFLPKMIFVFPLIMMLLIPWAANMEVKNLNITIIDKDNSTISNRLSKKIEGSDHFNVVNYVNSFNDALIDIEKGNSDLILEIPNGFERNVIREGSEKVYVAANAVNGTKGGLGSSYLINILNDFNLEIFPEKGLMVKFGAEIKPLFKYNNRMDYKVFMVPALMVMLLTMICGFLPALNIVSEKEAGTIEQINVTPVGKFSFILAKLIPYWVIGFIVLTICVIFASIVYGIFPEGSLFTFYLISFVFVLVVSGLGLVISNYSNTMQQAMFVMYFFMLILILLSGLFTPTESMPTWAEKITYANPMKYFIEVMRMIYLKGSQVSDLWIQIIVLSSFALFFNLWAVISYRKSS